MLALWHCEPRGPLYAVLRGYKESAVDEARRYFAGVVRDLLGTFLSRHAPCLVAAVGGHPDLVLPVPSTARPDGSPLRSVEGIGDLVATRLAGAGWAPGLLERADAPVGHMRPHPDAFSVPDPACRLLSDRRVVLLDDLYVSGARAQSAAAAVRAAGAGPVVVVAVGRLLRPDRSALHAAFVRGGTRSGIGGADPAVCCRCVQAWTRSSARTPVSSSEARHSAPASSGSRARNDGRALRGGPVNPNQCAGPMY